MDIYNQIKMIIGSPSGEGIDLIYIISCVVLLLFIISLFKIILSIFNVR